jgi:hypothetical protein
MARTASTLICGVVCGITIVAFSPSFFAENATPWEWLPALAVMMPRAHSSSRRCAILL